MKKFFDEKISTVKKRRHFLISDLQKNISQNEFLGRREAMYHLVNFINTNENIKVRTALDTMSGRGIFAESLLGIEGLEELTLNDIADDCVSHLQKKFPPIKKGIQIQIMNHDIFSLILNNPIDLIIIDFNNFTWNKKEQVALFLNWVETNRKNFRYLLFTDSFYYSLKFIKDPTLIKEKHQAYLHQTEKALCMKLLTSYVYRTRNCCSLLLENKIVKNS